MMTKAVIEIVEEYLQEHGYDGLFFPGECACEVGDLAPCGEYIGGCRVGYKAVCPEDEQCDACAEGSWHIQAEKARYYGG